LGGEVGSGAAILEDHAALATGLLALHQLTGDRSTLETAVLLIDLALAHFADADSPGRWFDSADDAEKLMVRPADPVDGATPSGASLIAEALLTAASLVDVERAARYSQAAADTLVAHTTLLARAARSAGHWLAVAEASIRGPLQISVACESSESSLLAAARELAPGGAVVTVGRDRVDDADAAYVCRGQVCDLPVTTVEDLVIALNRKLVGG
jgi:uncharacterized protein YyaL (SSP411 family)